MILTSSTKPSINVKKNPLKFKILKKPTLGKQVSKTTLAAAINYGPKSRLSSFLICFRDMVPNGPKFLIS